MQESTTSYTEVAVTGVNADGSPYSGTMLEASWAPTVSSPTGSKWGECVRCGHIDKLDAMARIGGQVYCTRYGCAEEKRK